MMRAKFLYLKVRGFLRRYLSQDISKSSFIGRNTQLLGIRNISIGENTTIGEGCTFTVNDRSLNYVTLKVGSNCFIGRNNFFAVGKRIEIGDYCIFGNNCSIMCSDHVFESPLVPYRMSGVTTEKKVKVGVNCWLGINVSILGNVTIGHGSIIGANTVITKDVPPFSIAVGNPFRIIKRFDFDQSKWISDDQIDDNRYFDEDFYLKYISSHFGSLSKAYHAASSQFGDI
ncbi:acyltransferase [Pedobacter sp. ASV1-7]|uniref:acyltransferase n=1 Tax=Pedobacter sp. ASV1-7 TaxID=3145237 RepID=UPI0032E86384